MTGEVTLRRGRRPLATSSAVMKEFGMVSTIFGILLSLTATVISSVQNLGEEPSWVNSEVGMLIFALVGIFQTSSSFLIFVYANNKNAEYPRIGWMLSTLATVFILFSTYLAVNYRSYVRFGRILESPLILHVVIAGDIVFLLTSLVSSLVVFQRMLDDDYDEGSISNNIEADEDILRL